MRSTIFKDVTVDMVKNSLRSIDLTSFYFLRHFPAKRIYNFEYNFVDKVNFKGDIIQKNSDIPYKSTNVATYEIPKIAMALKMQENELEECKYIIDNNLGKEELKKYWENDVKFCFRSVQFRLEYIAWSLVSNAGTLKLGKGFDIEYDIDIKQKKSTSTDWNLSNADILGDLRSLLKEANLMGISPKYAFVNFETFQKICNTEQMKISCEIADLEHIDKMLSRQPFINDLQFVIIDANIMIEKGNNEMQMINPFKDNVMVLSESDVLGETVYNIKHCERQDEFEVEHFNTIIRKYNEGGELTLAETYAMPILDSAFRNIYVNVDCKNW